jgi:hypothetical protein
MQAMHGRPASECSGAPAHAPYALRLRALSPPACRGAVGVGGGGAARAQLLTYVNSKSSSSAMLLCWRTVLPRVFLWTCHVHGGKAIKQRTMLVCSAVCMHG